MVFCTDSTRADHCLLVVPKSMRKGVVIAAHDYDSRFAVDGTVARITDDYGLLA